MNKILKCYLSGEVLTEENRSTEHIIHHFLGGKLKSPAIMNDYWNKKFSGTVDKELSNQILLGDTIPIKRDGPKKKRLIVKDLENNNEKFYLNTDRTMTSLPKNPNQKDESGNQIYQFTEEQYIEYVKSQKKKNPNITDEEINSWTIKEEVRDFDRKVVPSNPNTGLGPIDGIDAFRAIAKIAANFLMIKTKNPELLSSEIVNFIKGNLRENNCSYYCYQFERSELGIESDETSHILKVMSDIKNKKLMCYIEIFNVHNFLVFLNSEYDGEYLEFDYQINPLNRKETERKLPVNCSKIEYENLTNTSISFPLTKYDDRFLAFTNANNLKPCINK